MRIKGYSKRCKNCVFCNYWIEDIELKFVSLLQKYKYKTTAKG